MSFSNFPLLMYEEFFFNVFCLNVVLKFNYIKFLELIAKDTICLVENNVSIKGKLQSALKKLTPQPVQRPEYVKG